jgi:hypothetical protein
MSGSLTPNSFQMNTNLVETTNTRFHLQSIATLALALLGRQRLATTCGGNSAHPNGECHERTSNDDFGKRSSCRQPSRHGCASPRRRRGRWRWPHGRWLWRRPHGWLWWRSYGWLWRRSHGRSRKRPRRRLLRRRPRLPVLPAIHLAEQLRLLIGVSIRKPRTRGFRCPWREVQQPLESKREAAC